MAAVVRLRVERRKVSRRVPSNRAPVDAAPDSREGSLRCRANHLPLRLPVVAADVRGGRVRNRRNPPPYVGGYVGGYQSGAHRIGQRVETETGKRIPLPFLFAQDVLVRLMLPFTSAAQRRLQMRTEKFHRVELVSFAPESHPDQVQMIRHEAVGGAEKMFTHGGVEH